MFEGGFAGFRSPYVRQVYKSGDEVEVWSNGMRAKPGSKSVFLDLSVWEQKVRWVCEWKFCLRWGKGKVLQAGLLVSCGLACEAWHR